VLATRKPTLLLRLSGWFLLRLAERRLCGLLFQEPPRRTRRDGAVQAPGRNGCEARRLRTYGPRTAKMSRVAPAAPVIAAAMHKKIGPPSAGIFFGCVQGDCRAQEVKT
jgi:hypothetical protein